MPQTFVQNDPYFSRGSRYLRREKSGPSSESIDLSVTPAFPGLAAPAAPTATPSTTGGSLTAGTQSYVITRLNVNGETTPSAVGSATTTGTTASVALTWTPLAGATGGYGVYKLVGATYFLLAYVAAGVGNYSDTGSVTPNPATAAPTVNSTQVIANVGAGAVRAGDMLYRTASGKVAALMDPANSANMVGVSEDNYPRTLGFGSNVLIGIPDFDPTPAPRIDVRRSGEFQFKSTPGDVYAPNAPVYVGADAQTVTVTANGTPIGRVCPDQEPVSGGASSPMTGATSISLTGAVGQDVVVELAPPAAV